MIEKILRSKIFCPPLLHNAGWQIPLPAWKCKLFFQTLWCIKIYLYFFTSRGRKKNFSPSIYIIRLYLTHTVVGVDIFNQGYIQMKIVMATGNQGKVKELRELLKDLDYEVLSLKDFENINEVPETGTSFLENSCQKVEGYAKQIGEICLADDSGLCVDALNGGPGIYSARYANSDIEKCEKLLKEMADKDNREAHFNCFATLWLPENLMAKVKENKTDNIIIVNENIVATVGVLEGEIATEMKGEQGFGFDPVFIVKEFKKHLAELNSDEKNQISHRGKAMRKMVEILKIIQ